MQRTITITIDGQNVSTAFDGPITLAEAIGCVEMAKLSLSRQMLQEIKYLPPPPDPVTQKVLIVATHEMPHGFWDRHITQVFSTRVCNSLKNFTPQVNTVKQLHSLGMAKLKRMHGFGAGCVKEVQDMFNQYGIEI